jgi:hypothetical protein
VTLANIGDATSAKVRISKIDSNSHLQLWAIDTAGHWSDINVAGWGPTAGFPVPVGSVTTNVYAISDVAGSYPLTVNLVQVSDSSIVAHATGTVTVNEPAPVCSGAIGTTLLDVTQNITNDVDSGNYGNWALDAYVRHIQVWLDGTTYCAQADYSGTFQAPAGVLSPQNGTPITQNINGTMIGGYRASIVGTPINFTSVLTTVDYQGVVSTGAIPGYISWLGVTFNPGYIFHYLNSDTDWSWTYSTLHSGSWTNAGTGSSGDIIDAIPSATTNPATPITSTDATLNGINGDTNATGHSFWVSTSTFGTSDLTPRAGLYWTDGIGAVAANTAFSAALSSVKQSTDLASIVVTPNTTYYFAAWSQVGGTWYPGAVLSFTTAPTPPPVDTTPDAFSFTDQTDVALSTMIESNAITVAGINASADVWAGGEEYSINDGAYTSISGAVSVGDTVKVRHTSSASNSTAVDTILTIGGVSDTFTSTTVAASNNGGGGSGLSDGLGCANHDCSGNQIGGGGGAPSGGAVLGISTGPAALGLATLLPVTLGTNVLGAEVSPAQSGEVLGTATGSATPTPTVSPTPAGQNPVSSSTNWALGYMPIGLVILIVLALIAYLIYRKKRNK